MDIEVKDTNVVGEPLSEEELVELAHAEELRDRADIIGIKAQEATHDWRAAHRRLWRRLTQARGIEWVGAADDHTYRVRMRPDGKAEIVRVSVREISSERPDG